jgi:dUTPase
MVIARYERVELQAALSLDDTARGAAGFGSTGR